MTLTRRIFHLLVTEDDSFDDVLLWKEGDTLRGKFSAKIKSGKYFNDNVKVCFQKFFGINIRYTMFDLFCG